MTLMLRKYTWRERLRLLRLREFRIAWCGYHVWDEVPGFRARDPLNPRKITGQVLVNINLRVK